MLRLAVAKGRTADAVVNLFEKAGIVFTDYAHTRKLLMRDKDKQIELILVKPIDTPIYVESGAADCGIAGLDILKENEADIYPLMRLDASKCEMILAVKEGDDITDKRFLTVATKYPRITQEYFDKQNKEVKIIHLSGALELAPILNMADAIVDIRQTGKTLKENGLIAIEEFMDISACFIANKVSLKTRYAEIKTLMDKLTGGGAE